jgi:hypothetical protein
VSLVDQPLFAVPKGRAAKDLDKLHKRRRELQHQQREALQAGDSARSQHERLDEQVRASEALSLAFDQPASTKRDRARLGRLATQAADSDHKAAALAAAIVAVEQEIRKRAQAGYDELVEEAVSDHEQARYQVSAALASLEAAQARARGAYIAAQAITANAGRTHIRMRDVPNLEQLVRDGGLGPLINSTDLTVAA